MAILIQSFTDEWREAVSRFNARLRAGGVAFQFPERRSSWLSRERGSRVFQDYFILVEGNAEVRGGYILKSQPFHLPGGEQIAAAFRLPLSEGLVDPHYGMTGVQLLFDVLKRQPLLYGLGMGSRSAPVAKMLGRAGWKLQDVPFYFRVCHAGAFLRNAVPLRKPRWRAVLAHCGAVTGLGGLGIGAWQMLHTRPAGPGRVTAEEVEQFEGWADEVWAACRGTYSMCAVRDADTLNTMYPHAKQPFIRLRVSVDGATAGWAVLLKTQMTHHKYFGNMRVGTIVDCLACEGRAAHVLRAAVGHLRRLGSDLIVSNQLNQSWQQTFEHAGFLRGPSNFIFAVSPKLAGLIEGADPSFSRVHMGRGDGDGPIGL